MSNMDGKTMTMFVSFIGLENVMGQFRYVVSVPKPSYSNLSLHMPTNTKRSSDNILKRKVTIIFLIASQQIYTSQASCEKSECKHERNHPPSHSLSSPHNIDRLTRPSTQSTHMTLPSNTLAKTCRRFASLPT